MIKTIGAYWVQMGAYGRGDGGTEFMTVAVMAYSIEDALKTAEKMVHVQSYGCSSWNHIRDGVIDLEILKSLIKCDDHPEQVLSPAVHGVLQRGMLPSTEDRNAPDLEHVLIGKSGPLSGWCAAGSHRLEPLLDPELEKALIGAIIQ